jgi:hypothetical protein
VKPSLLVACCAAAASAQSVTVQVLADSGRIPISPWIYGRNNSMSDVPSQPVPDSATTLYNEAGLRMLRETGGNNLTKYNWRKKLTSHPDWYNNVYAHDWDYSAASIQAKLPNAQSIFGFGLLGWVVSNTNNNFNDGAYNNSAWWNGVEQNLAGGGVPNAAGGSVAKVQGDATKYTTPWPADSVAGILDSWFGPGGDGLDSTRLRYWSMDNEPDCWNGTHDDVDSLLTGHTLTPEEYVQRWKATAFAVRAKFPGIKLVGPASASEWQWYNWPTGSISYKGASYCFPEYLIKRLAEIQDSTGVRMIDVYDVHLYFQAGNKTDALQTQRILFDTNYMDPNANGVHTVNGGWDTSIKRQYFFARVRGWLDKYFGVGNGVGVGSTESGVDSSVSNHASESAVWHASILGTFADNRGEIYTAWSWNPGMWEALHLFSRYAHNTRVKSVSTLDSLVSGYSSISAAGDSLLVVLVNRDASNAHATTVNLSGFSPTGNAVTLQLANLNGETFHSNTNTALKTGSATVSGTSLSLTLPKMSITAVQLLGTGNAVSSVRSRTPTNAKVTLLPGILRVEADAQGTVLVLDFHGRVLARSSLHQGMADIAVGGLARGLYTVQWPGGLKRVALLGN